MSEGITTAGTTTLSEKHQTHSPDLFRAETEGGCE